MGIANCPHCGESINELINISIRDEWKTGVPTWVCPECFTIIGTSEPGQCYY